MHACLRVAVIAGGIVFAMSNDAAAQGSPPLRAELGVRAGMALGDGKPANDLEVAAVTLRWRLDEAWSVQFGVRRDVFDAERPATWLGLTQDRTIEAIDAKAKATVVGLGLRRDQSWPGSRWSWFWHAELSTAKPDVPTVRGPLDGGGSFEVSTAARREWIVGAGAGLRWQFAPRWAAEFGAQAEHHQARWRVSDAVSGRTGSLGAYQTVGLWLGLAASF